MGNCRAAAADVARRYLQDRSFLDHVAVHLLLEVADFRTHFRNGMKIQELCVFNIEKKDKKRQPVNEKSTSFLKQPARALSPLQRSSIKNLSIALSRF